jgi:hypothetical protein
MLQVSEIQVRYVSLYILILVIEYIPLPLLSKIDVQKDDLGKLYYLVFTSSFLKAKFC